MSGVSRSKSYERIAVIVAVASLLIIASLFLALYVPTATSTAPSTNFGTTLQNAAAPGGQNGTDGLTTSVNTSQYANITGSVPIYVYNAQGALTSFTPDSVKLVIGVNNTVAFVNSGKDAVVVESESWPTNATAFESPLLLPGGAYVLTFSTPGVYTCVDYFHGSSTGKIIVIA